jgi:hypothetical protein
MKFANAIRSTGNPEYPLANVGHPSDCLWPGYVLVRLPVKVCGIRHLAKNERDVGPTQPSLLILKKGQ